MLHQLKHLRKISTGIPNKTTADVIIGGGGPVGLFLACELGLAGVSVLVLEQDTERSSPWKTKPLGTRGLNTLSLEAFHRRGLIDKILDHDKNRPTNIVKTPSFQPAGHFARIMLDTNKLDLSRWKYRLPGPSLIPYITDLERVTAVLSERAENLGVRIFRGKAVTGLSQDSDSVMVQSGNEFFYAKYLVGCDGGRSTIRKEAGFEFVGTDPKFTAYNVHCELDNLEKLGSGQMTPRGQYIVGKQGMYTIDKQGYIYVMDFDGGAFDRSQPVTREHFQNVLRRISGTDVVVKELHLAWTFTDRAMQATTYRKGRVLLAGDSAHIHSPLGGQGLNTGIGDAINLGWKLAETLKGTAPEGLLDTYTEERHPIAKWALEWTRAQVTIMEPNLFGTAIAQIMRDLVNTSDGANYFIDRLWGLSQRYNLGDEHPLVGASAPDFEFASGTRLANQMESGKGLLVDFTNNSSLAELAANWEMKLDCVNTQAKNNLGLKAMFVRPDGIVAWVAEHECDLVAAKTAFLRWIGPIQKPNLRQNLNEEEKKVSSRKYHL